MASSFALAFHELSTNTAKYGALSSLDGYVEILWRISPAAEGVLELIWTEHGGPPVSRPTWNGFGSRLIDALTMELGVTVSVDFPVSVVVWRFVAPLAKSIDTDASTSAV